MRAKRGPLILIEELTRANPWWRSQNWEEFDLNLVAAARAPFQRRPDVLDDIIPPNLYTLRGPRRTGKTTVLKQTVARLSRGGVDPRRIFFFAADALSTHTDLINLFQAASFLFPDLGDIPRFWLIDEITAIPDWQRGIKWVRDNTRAANDCIVATGSSADDIAEGTVYLAGRRGPGTGLDRLLLPMSYPEFARCAGYQLPASPAIPFETFYTEAGRKACQEALVEIGTLSRSFEAFLSVGGFPQAVADFRNSGQVSDGLVRDLWDVVQSDLRAMGLARPEQALRLLDRISAGISGPMVIRTIASQLDVSHPTISSWLSTLANSYLVLVIFQESNGVPDVRKQRKVYPVDPLVARLAARLSPGAQGPDASQLAEATIAAAIFRAVEGDTVDRFARPGRLFFYRTPHGEVDFVVSPHGLAVESKYIDEASRRAGRTMRTAFGKGLLLTRSAIEFSPDITILPTPLFCWLLAQKG